MTARSCPSWCTDHLDLTGSADGAVEHRGPSLEAPIQDLRTPLVARLVQEVNDHGSEDPHVQLLVPHTLTGQLGVDLNVAEAVAEHLLAAIRDARRQRPDVA